MAIEAPAFIGTAEPIIVAYDIGGTNCRGTIGNGNGTIGRIEKFDTPEDIIVAVDGLAAMTRELTGGKRPDFFGVAIAGEVSSDGETIVRAGPLQEYGWVHKPIRSMIAEANGMSSENVEMRNDSDSAGEAQREADKDEPYLHKGGQGYIETISSGNGGAIFDKRSAHNVEPGHIDSGERAPVVCGCTGERCIEAWISGNSVAKAWDIRMENVPYDDPRWDQYEDTFYQMQVKKIDALRERGFDPQRWYMFGSVALKGPRNILGDFAQRLAQDERRAMPVLPATYRDDSGLNGAYFAARELALVS